MFSLSYGSKEETCCRWGVLCIEQTQSQLCSNLVANNEPGSGNLGGWGEADAIPVVARQLLCTCAVCVPSLLTITACRGKNGRADKARVVQVTSPPAETAMSSWAEISGNGFFLSSVVVTASDETDFYRHLVKLKIHCFHLNRGEWFRIKSKLEQQILVFLAIGHSHFWENKNWGLPLLLSSLFYMFSDNFA